MTELQRLRQIARAAGAWKTADNVWVCELDTVWHCLDPRDPRIARNNQMGCRYFYSTRKAATAAAKKARRK